MPNCNGKVPSLWELAQKYHDQDNCLELLESLRWPNGPVCPQCGSKRAYGIKARRVHECGGCHYQYSATTGTVMHSTKLPLTKWILVTALICNGRKGISACQMARDLHLTYKTAWYLGHRLRRAMRESEWLEKFTGICEIDES